MDSPSVHCRRLNASISHANDMTQECAEVPETGYAESHPGKRVAGSGAAAEISRARAQRTRFGRMRAARSEFDDGPPLGRLHAARGFGCDQRGKRDGGKQIGFRDLGFDDGRAKAQHRLAGKERRAFRNGEEIAGEAKGTQVVEEFGRRVAELYETAQVRDIFVGESQVQEIFDGLREARRQ